MDLKAFLAHLPAPLRKDFATRAECSYQTLVKVANGSKQVGLGFADVIVALSGGKVTLDELPLADRAKRQHAIRDEHGHGRTGKDRRTGIRRRVDRGA